MQISAKAEYAVRAMLVMAADPDGRPIKGETIATSQGLPVGLVESTLIELRRAGLVASRRGLAGGFRLAKAADRITIADVLRVIDGPLAEVGGVRPNDITYDGPAERLQVVWIATRANLRAVLEHVTLADVVHGTIPARIVEVAEDPDAWQPH